MKGPHWTKNWIENLWRFTSETFVDYDSGKVDYEALGREEFEFRKALFYRNFKNSKRAKIAFEEANEFYKSHVESGKKGGRPKKSPQDAPNGNAGVDMYDAGNGAASKSRTSCDQFTADGDIREDSQDRKSGTSANHYGDAATREGADESTTVSGQFRGSAKNQGKSNTGSTVPAVCPESGDISKARQSQARESQRRAGADSVRGTPLHSAPARSSGTMPADVQVVYDFAAAENLDPVDAYECWNVTVNERDGKTADGKRITNWKAYVRKWCVTRASNRRTA